MSVAEKALTEAAESVRIEPDTPDLRTQFQAIMARAAVDALEPEDDESDRPRSPAEQLKFALSGWAAQKEVENVFIPWVRELIREYKVQQRSVLGKHAELAYWLGVEDILSTLVDTFHSWADKADAPATRRK